MQFDASYQTARVRVLGLRHVGGKAGLIIGDDRTLLIDAGADTEEGAAIIACARALGHEPDTLVYTHGHWDHVRGGVAFRGPEVFAHAHAVPAIRIQLALEGRDADADGGQPSTNVLTTPISLDLGGVHVELLETPGHAPGSLSVLVQEEGVLFAGDTVVTAIPPVFGDGDSVTLERTLRTIAAIGVQTLVPGHGAIVRGSDAVRVAVLARADYLSHTRERAASLFGPMGVDEIVDELALRTARDGPFDVGVVPLDDLRVRHGRMVQALVAELGLRPRR